MAVRLLIVATMSTAQHTDERLRNSLDGQQLSRERLCLAVLGLDNRFANIKPRNPRGGPDGGRDIEAVFQGSQVAWGAVGFQNSVNDSSAQRKKAAKKFSDDLSRAKEE